MCKRFNNTPERTLAAVLSIDDSRPEPSVGAYGQPWSRSAARHVGGRLHIILMLPPMVTIPVGNVKHVLYDFTTFKPAVIYTPRNALSGASFIEYFRSLPPVSYPKRNTLHPLFVGVGLFKRKRPLAIL